MAKDRSLPDTTGKQEYSIFQLKLQWGLEYQTRSDLEWLMTFGFLMVFEQNGRHFVQILNNPDHSRSELWLA